MNPADSLPTMNTQRTSLAVSLLGFLALAYIFFPESTDDAYITLRFSRNLLLGNGPVFNIGERVEGYSNFAWMALLAGFGWAGIAMESAMKYLSLASGLGVLALVWKLSTRYFKSALAISTAMILLGCGSFFAVWAVDGLETMFYTMLLTALVFALTTDRRNAVLIGILAGLAALTRPEGIMFALIAVAWLTWKDGYRPGLKALALLVLCAGGYEWFRLDYFGQYIANSAAAKLHIRPKSPLQGLDYLFACNSASGYLLLPAALAGAAAAIRNERLRVPVIFVLAQIFFLVVTGGDFMHAFRFIVPVVPCIVLLCAAAIEGLHERVNRALALTAMIALVVSQAVFQYASLPAKHIGLDNLSYRSSSLYNIADFLARGSGKDDWILLSEAGIIPYYDAARVMDYMGLVTRFDAVFGEDFNSAQLFSVHPKFIVISMRQDESGRFSPRMWTERALVNDPGFSSYRYVRSFDVPRDASFLNAIYYKYYPQDTRISFAVFERRHGQ